ncbi:uncharacterized protein LOC130323573 [Hyla sarda]|uniref:uncharacterized protein LOC130323573 n=1 Tax=Hyla sarda TaxID=327740 RepID=UPI0024C333A3|nr:uncharacterized protein LOC130323573 [Hyla sarda]
MQSSERSTRSSKRHVLEPTPNREPPNTTPDSGQYICIECSETFNNKLELNSHRQSHVTKKQFTCSHCGRGFHHQFFLQMHERSHEDGISRTLMTKPSTSRVMSTRSRKPLPEADIIHVTASPSRSVYHLNSKVEFKKEWKSNQNVTPTECVTRRTQGTYTPAHQRTDGSDKNAQFELRISKLSDSSVHLIDPYGNTLEILAEVFNTYTIGEAEEEDESVSTSSESRPSDIPDAPPSSTVHPDKVDEMETLSSSPAEVSEPSETIYHDAMCGVPSVSSPSISPKTLPDLGDDSEDVLPQQMFCEDVVKQPDTETPKNSTELESLPKNAEDSMITCDEQAAPKGPVVGELTVCNNELSVVTGQTQDASLKVAVQDDPSSVENSEVLRGEDLHKEDDSPKPTIHVDHQEQDGSVSSLPPVTESPSVTVSQDVSEDKDQLATLCAEDSNQLKSDQETSLPEAVTEHNIKEKGLEGSEAEASLASLDKVQEVTMEVDRTEPQTPVTESHEHHKEGVHVSSTEDHDHALHPDPSTVCDTPIDNINVAPKDGSDGNEAASKSELEPDLSDASVCRLDGGVHDQAPSPLPPDDVCASEPLNITSVVMSPDQRPMNSSDHEERPEKRDDCKKVLSLLDKQDTESVMSDTLSPIAGDAMFETQTSPEQVPETMGDGGEIDYEKTDDLLIDNLSQKNDHSSEPSPVTDPRESPLLHHIQPPGDSNVKQDVNLSDNKVMDNVTSSAVKQSTENEETEGGDSGVTPVEAASPTHTENTIDKSSSEDISMQVNQCDDVEKISAVESSENNPSSLLESGALTSTDDLLPIGEEDLSLTNNTESRGVSFNVPTLESITSAFVKAQELVLSQETTTTEQDPAVSVTSDEKFGSSKPIDDLLLQKLEGEDSGTTLSLLEPALALSPDIEDLSEKCLLSSDDMKDLTECDIEKNLSFEDPQKQYIQMSNADLTENDLSDDFVASGSILLDAPSLEETTKEDDISAVSVEGEGTLHELSDMLSPEIQESEVTESQDDKLLSGGGPCLKCGRRVRRGRKELVWFPICYKCRLKVKREERHSGEGTSPDFSNFLIKQEADSAQDNAIYRTVKPGHNIHSIKQESASLLRKMYKCPKCVKSFRIPSLLASHMKCHTLPQCLTCGCPLTLDKTKRIPKSCRKCVQKIKQQKKEPRALCAAGDEEEDSLDSDSGSLSADEADLQSLTDDDEPSPSSTEREETMPGSVMRGTKSFHSKVMRKRKMNPAKHALYCTCDVVLKSGARQPKICKNCQKPVQDRLVTFSKASLIEGCHTVGGKQLKTKKRPLLEPDQENMLLGDSSLSHENKLSPDDDDGNDDEFCNEEIESFTELNRSDQSAPPDGEKPRLCPECGKVFKCNRSLNLHLLSHSATQCESCGCRLQKKKRAGRWSKRCRVCRLLTKDKGLPDNAIEDELQSDKIPKEKNVASVRLKMKRAKAVRSKIKSAAKLKKELNWMNMLLAVKGLTQKPRKKKVQAIKSAREEKSGYGSEPAEESEAYSSSEEKTSLLKGLSTPSKCDPGPSELHVRQKKLLGGVSKANKKCMYREKNIIKVEEQQLPPYSDDPLGTAVSVKEEEENQCLECNEIFPNFDLLLDHQKGHFEGQPFTCSQCPQSFSTEQYLSIHISAHAEGPPFRCPECNKTFTRRNHLGVHRRVHTGSRPYACPDCSCRFRQRGSLIIHRYTHRNIQLMMLKPYQCSVCNKSFKQKERLVIHERLHTGECPFSCKDCDKVFPSKSRLYVHRKMHKVPEASSSAEQNASCQEESEGPPFQCKDCEKICSTKASFVLHRKIHKSSAVLDQSSSNMENQEGTTNEMPSTSEEDLGIKTEQEGNPFSCNDCTRVFSTKASFVLHRKVHSLGQNSQFVCKDCGKVCSTKASLVLHRKVHKSPLMSDLKANIGDPPYICKLCKKVCSTKASFVLHCKVHKVLSGSEKILKTTMEQKSFLCKKCGVVCSTKASFVLHRKIHRSSPNLEQKDGTGPHPFTCKDCGKVCSTKASFVLHCKVHKVVPDGDQSSVPQADVEEKPYHCKECGKIYSTKGRLLSHMKLHADLETSAEGEQLLNIDAEEKPFACPICHMRFTRLKILVRHKLIHGEDVFRCGHCGKRFLFQKSLMNHVPVCLKRTKGKALLGKDKVPKKRKLKDGNEESAPKKRKYEHKKAVTAAQKLKNKKLMKVKKLAANKEKTKLKNIQEKKLKKPKGEAELDPEAAGENDGKQERPLEIGTKESGKEKKPKDGAKVKKILKKVPQKRQKVSSESLKKWRMIAAATVKKRKLQAVISGGKKNATMKKKAPSKTKTGGKSSKD